MHDGGDRPGSGEVLPGGGVEHLVQVGSGQGGRVDLALEDRPLRLGLIAGVLGWGQARLQPLVYGRVHAGPGGGGVHGQEVAGVGGERLGLTHGLRCRPRGFGPVQDVG